MKDTPMAAMSLNDALVEVINERIESRGMSQASLARLAGMSRDTLRNYTQRKRSKMGVDVIDEIAPHLGLTTYELVRLAQARRDQEEGRE